MSPPVRRLQGSAALTSPLDPERAYLWLALTGSMLLATGALVAGYVPPLLPAYKVGLLLAVGLAWPFALNHPGVLFIALAGLLPMGFLGRLDLGGIVPALHSVLHIMGLLIASAWLSATLLAHRPIRYSMPLLLLMGWGVAVVALIPLGTNAAHSFFVVVRYYLPFLTLVALAVNLLDHRRLIEGVCIALTLSMGVTAAALILMRLGLLSIEGVHVNFLGRLGSFGGGQASTSFYFMVAIAIAAGLIRVSAGATRRRWIAILALLLAGNMMTVSLSGTSAILIVLFLTQLPPRSDIWTGARAIVVRSIPVSLAVLLALAVAFPLFLRRLTGKWLDLSTETIWAMASGRLGPLVAGIDMISDRPLTGVGVGNVGRAIIPFLDRIPHEYAIPIKEGVVVKMPDNTYVELFSEVGIPLALCFLGVVLLTALRVYRHLLVLPDERLTGLAWAILMALPGVAWFGFFNDIMRDKVMWFYLAVLFSVERLTDPMTREVSAQPTLLSRLPAEVEIHDDDRRE